MAYPSKISGKFKDAFVFAVLLLLRILKYPITLLGVLWITCGDAEWHDTDFMSIIHQTLIFSLHHYIFRILFRLFQNNFLLNNS